VASDVIEAIDWAIDNRRAYNIRVINLSLGAPVLQPYSDDPVCEAVERAVAAGIVVVTAAGNYGVASDGRTVLASITSPGNDPSAITVGALDTHGTSARTDDTVARFSSKGPTRFDLVLKPDLVAPGTRVVSAEAAGSYLATTSATRHVAGSGSTAYMQMSGTSMAAAVVSGTAALLLQEQPKLAPRELKLALQVTSTFMPAEGLVRAGTGSVSVLAAAMLLEVNGQPASKSGEWNPPSGRLAIASLREWSRRSILRAFGGADAIVWGLSVNDTIVWGSGMPDTIYWGSVGPDTIYWGSGVPDTIYWGSVLNQNVLAGAHTTGDE